MIWSIVSKDEMDNYGTSPVYRFYSEALGAGTVSLAVVETNDPLDFIKEDDIVLLRTASRELIATIRSKNVRTTAELFTCYDLANDKLRMNDFLRWHGIPTPHNYNINELEEGKTYFVKPRYGSDSFGITKDSICHTQKEVRIQARTLNVRGISALIDEFIEGSEYTVVCLRYPSHFMARAIEVRLENTGGIQTEEGKANFKEYGVTVNEVDNMNLCLLAKKVFGILGLKHHARIDFRRDLQGNFYVIDVNLLPGLGPTGDLARCLLLTDNYSYTDALNLVLATATKI